MRTRFLALALLTACSAATPPPAAPRGDADASEDRTAGPATARAGVAIPSAEAYVIENLREPGGAPTLLYVRDGRIADPARVSEAVTRVDGGGAYVVPGVIDAHVHFAYLPAHEAHAEGGVAGAVDLASPTGFLMADLAPMRVLRSGPMITAPGGYPTRSWGADGYGFECEGAAACAEAVVRLAGEGADLIKVPLTTEPTLSDEELGAVVVAAHERGLLVAAHALSEAAAGRAAAAGVDVLAHTPIAALSEETVAALSGATVISTLAAFGGSTTAVDNLARLRRAGADVVYGTDFGNTRAAGIDRRELLLLLAAGLDERAIIDAMTRTPAERFGFDALGSLAPNRAASFLLLSEDPVTNVLTLASPIAVVLDGVRY